MAYIEDSLPYHLVLCCLMRTFSLPNWPQGIPQFAGPDLGPPWNFIDDRHLVYCLVLFKIYQSPHPKPCRVCLPILLPLNAQLLQVFSETAHGGSTLLSHKVLQFMMQFL